MKSKLRHTFYDVFLICSPLLILFYVLAFEGAAPGDIWKKPEWSFISVVLIAESFRDFGEVWRSKGDHDEEIAGGYGFMAVVQVFIGFVLLMDYRHFAGSTAIDTESVYLAKFITFGVALGIFAKTRWKKHAMQAPKHHQTIAG